ncbi:hypothetical protein D3C87_2186850 [compost metagenome]
MPDVLRFEKLKFTISEAGLGYIENDFVKSAWSAPALPFCKSIVNGALQSLISVAFFALTLN